MLYIVIPVFNRKKFTCDCLLSLQYQTRTGHKIVVVDDGSTDGTDVMLAEEFPEVKVIKGNGNLYWTAAVNLGIRYALQQGADYVMTLNNDTITSPDFIEKMLGWSVQKPDALLGALELDAMTEKPYYGGERIDWRWDTTTYLLDILGHDERNGLHEVSVFPGRGLLIPRKVFETIGLFAERLLPHYMADYDFTALAIRKGFKVYCNYDACLYTYPEEGGDMKLRRSKNLVNYLKHLFSIKGGGNLRNFTVFVFRNSPASWIALHLAKGYTRRIFGYFLH
jgi:GT2 family glycosyltransferase